MDDADLPLITHPGVDRAWLATCREEPLDPTLRIVDPHHHLWDRSGGYYLDELLADTGSGHFVEATVYVQCHYGYRTDGAEALKPVGETAFAAGVGAASDTAGSRTRACAAIVGFADLELGDAVDEVLEAHIEAGCGRFRGIRRLAAHDPAFRTHLPRLSAGLMAEPAFRRGYSRLARHGLTFDAWVYHPQIAEVAALAGAFPDTPIVIDHVGTPLGIGPYAGRAEATFAAWRRDMAALACRPNAFVKLGGLAMAVNGFAFHRDATAPSSQRLADAWRPYIDTCIALFGADRCMFESNFPVDKAMCSYGVLWNAFKRLVAGATVDEKAALFHGTAATFYRLPASGSGGAR